MNHQDETNNNKDVSRRSFFGTAGTFLAGAAVTAAGCSSIMTKKQEEIVEAPVTWPYPYVQLDPDDIRIRGYVGYYKLK